MALFQSADTAETAPAVCTAAQLHAALHTILQEPLASVMERESTALDRVLDSGRRGCVLFGAGSLGRQALAALRSIGIAPLAIADNNRKLWGTSIDGIPLLSPADAAQRHGKDIVFFITIRNEHHGYLETAAQLERLGCTTICSTDPIAWRFPESLQPQLLYDLPHKLYQQAQEILCAGEMWADDNSRATYLNNIRLRALGDRSWFPRPVPEESYFLDDVFQVTPSDVFLDCGAFDGDTIRNLLHRQTEWAGIEAVEADPISCARLRNYVETLAPPMRDRIHAHACAIGATEGKVRFAETGKDGSAMTDTGGTVVDLMPIDTLFANTPISIVKMDIEGAEFDGLTGARHVIERDHPILAICAYHRQDDIWKLPVAMRALNPEYRLYLRTHGGDGIQTVVYAVPAHRITLP